MFNFVLIWKKEEMSIIKKLLTLKLTRRDIRDSPT